MANTKTLRRRILKEIAALQEKLRAIELVESMSREMEHDEAPRPSETQQPTNGSGTLIGTCEKLLTEQWQSVNWFVDKVRAVHPDAHRAAISTAFRRLAERGRADAKSLGSRKEGYEYKRKAHPSQPA